MAALLVKVLVAYLLGSVSGSLLLGRFKHVDIRTRGSGNAGGTNAFRVFGFWFAAAVVVIDVGKGVLAAGVVPGVVLPGLPDPYPAEVTALACGFAAVLGHCYPIYHGFRGGKGAATAIGALLVIQPWLILPMLATWLVTLGVTGYVGISTVLAGYSLVPGALWLSDAGPLLVFCLALALFLTFTHRENLRRMRAGTENRFERARVVSWFRK